MQTAQGVPSNGADQTPREQQIATPSAKAADTQHSHATPLLPPVMETAAAASREPTARDAAAPPAPSDAQLAPKGNKLPTPILPPLPRITPQPAAQADAPLSGDADTFFNRATLSRILWPAEKPRERWHALKWLLGGSPFTLRERDWRRSALLHWLRTLPGLATILVVALLASAFALVLATHTSHLVNSHPLPLTTKLATATPNTSSMVIQQPPASGAPTPQAVPYLIGVWPSDLSPQGGAGSVQIFVRVTHDAEPVGGVMVRITVSDGRGTSHYGPTRTASNGLATFTIIYSGGPGQPVFVDARASVEGQSLDAQTTFIPG